MAVLDANFATVNDTATLRNPGGGRAKSAQSYKATYSGAITSCKMQMKRLGSPTGNAWIEIYASSSGLPTGSVLATSSTRVIDAFSTSQTLQEFTFSTPYIQTANSYYCIAICGDWTQSNTDTLQANISYDNGAAYANGLFSFYNGSTWAEAYPTHNSDVAFEIYVSYIKKIMGIPRAAHQIADDPLFSDANLQGYWKLENTTDSGPNGYTLTNNGTTTFTSGKFNNAGTLVGASSQYLSIADASCANLEISTSQTWVVWIKPTAVNATQMIMAKQNTGNGHNLYLNSDATLIFAPDGLTPGNITSTQTVSAGVWSQIVGRYNSSDNTLAIFVNGVKKSVSVSGSAADTNSEFCIGRRTVSGSNLYFTGQIDDAAIWNRALTDTEISRLYTGNIKKFNSLIMNNGYDEFVKALLHFDGTDASTTFTDETAKTWTARNQAQIDTAQYKFGTASGLFDGTADSIDTPDSADWNLGTTFTIDMFVRFNGTPTLSGFCGQYVNTSNWWFFNYHSALGLFVGSVIAGSDVGVCYGAWTPSASTWYHIAWVCNAGTTKLYVDGISLTLQANNAMSAFTDHAAVLQIGKMGDGSGANTYQMNGWIDEFRISKGVARWTANFTPPTAPYSVSQIKKYMGISNV